MEFAQPPPDMSLPPPIQGPPPTQHNFNVPPPLPGTGPPQTRHNMYGPVHHQNHFSGGHGHHSGAGKPGHPYFKPFTSFNRGHGNFGMTQDDFDGKRLRKSVMRKTVDYNSSIVRSLENRIWQRDFRDRHALQPESIYIPELLPPPSYLDNPSNAVTTRFVKTATNKMRCPIFTLAWTPEGRRLVTGASSGEFTLWNGLTFNFETILQAHDVPVRTMVWSHNDSWMVTGDHAGYVKYWQSNMNNVKMFQAHKEPIRGISFSPTDSKFVSCSDDGTLRVWDFLRCQEERVLRGHGADVKCVHWHPQKSLIVSGSKDNQQPIKLWDPKGGQALATLHAHKSTVMDLKWNDNGNWLVTASRDHLLKLFDLRYLKEEVQIFRGHKKEASSVSWHPVHEGLFSSGGSDGSILFWNVGTDKEIGGIETAHDSIVWTLAWHPLGHILCSGSNDHTIKFWTRNRPGDAMRDKYNLNTLPASLAMLDECEYEEAIIPGMGLGPEDKVEFTESLTADKGFIPGLDLDPNKANELRDKEKKVPYSKPIPRNFQAQWNDSRNNDDDANDARDYKESHMENNVGGPISVDSIDPNIVSGILVYGKFVPVISGSNLAKVIRQGPEALNKYINLGEVEELMDVLPYEVNDSLSPTERFSNSPTHKTSRVENRNHNAQIIYSNDVDMRHQTTSVAAIPSLLGLKVPAPDNFVDIPKRSPQERNFGDDRPNPWAVDDKNRPSPWASGLMAPGNGFNQGQFNFNQSNPFSMNNNPFSGNGSNNEPLSFDQNNDFRGNGRNLRFDGPFNNNFNDFNSSNNSTFDQNQSSNFQRNIANDLDYEDSQDFRGNDGSNGSFNNGSQATESRSDMTVRASGRPSRFSDNTEWSNDGVNSGRGGSSDNVSTSADRDSSRNSGGNSRRRAERRSQRNNRNNNNRRRN